MLVLPVDVTLLGKTEGGLEATPRADILEAVQDLLILTVLLDEKTKSMKKKSRKRKPRMQQCKPFLPQHSLPRSHFPLCVHACVAHMCVSSSFALP